MGKVGSKVNVSRGFRAKGIAGVGVGVKKWMEGGVGVGRMSNRRGAIGKALLARR